MTLQEILSRLQNVKKNGTGYTAKCPAHRDDHNSLSVSEKSDKILLKCFAGCAVNDVCAASGIELKDLFFEPYRDNQAGVKPAYNANTAQKQTDREKNVVRREPVCVYDYADETGEILYHKHRVKLYFDDGTTDKEFYFTQPDGAKGLNGARRVPYRLPELVEAAGRGADIFLCEGEKDADNLRTLGLTATSFKNWKSEFNQYLKSSHVCLICDHDKAGIKQANDACKLLSGNVASLKTLDFYAGEPLPEKRGKDFTDWFEAQKQNGLSLDEIAERLCILTDNASDWKPDETSEDAEPKAGNRKEKFRFNFTTLDDLYLEPEEETAFVWDKTLPVGGFSICSAKPKVGKSTVARNLAVAVSRGEPFLGRETIKGRVLYLCLEEKRAEVRKHFRQMGADGTMILIHSGACPQTSAEAIDALSIAIADIEPVLVIIDPLSRVLRTADFNDYRIAYALEPFIDLGRKTGVHSLALHHDGKGERDGGDAILGSTALFGAVDCHIQMKKRERGRTLSTVQRYGEDLPETVIELDKETGLIIEKGDLQTAIVEDVKQEVLDNLAEGETLSQADIKERVKGKAGIVSKAIARLLEENKLFREGEGKRGKPYLYGKVSGNEKEAVSRDSRSIHIEIPRNLETEKEMCPTCERGLDRTASGQMFCEICLYTK